MHSLWIAQWHSIYKYDLLGLSICILATVDACALEWNSMTKSQGWEVARFSGEVKKLAMLPSMRQGACSTYVACTEATWQPASIHILGFIVARRISTLKAFRNYFTYPPKLRTSVSISSFDHAMLTAFCLLLKSQGAWPVSCRPVEQNEGLYRGTQGT